jgi:hypothetical protein
MLHLSRSIPVSSPEWTDSGNAHESRGLKHRAAKEVRPVPACPELVAHIKRHVSEYGTGPDGRLLRGVRGERLSEVTVGRAWLNAGVQPTLVAEWAGHSVQVLLCVYAKCIERQDAQSRKLVENALGEPEQHNAAGHTGNPERTEPQDDDGDAA